MLGPGCWIVTDYTTLQICEVFVHCCGTEIMHHGLAVSADTLVPYNINKEDRHCLFQGVEITTKCSFHEFNLASDF